MMNAIKNIFSTDTQSETPVFDVKAVVAAWKKASKSDRRFSELRPYSDVHPDIMIRYSGWLKAHHHVLYNMVRGKKLCEGFSTITNSNKLNNGMDPQEGLKSAVRSLRSLVIYAQEVKRPNVSKYYQDRLDKFLEPFDGSITVEDLQKLDPESIKIN